MMVVKRTNSDNLDFQKLSKALDDSLETYYKEEGFFYETLNAIDKINHVIIVYNENDIPIGCGGIKVYSKDEIEIKRMYVPISQRRKGIGTIVLNALEKWAHEMHYKTCILETLKEKPYAINFYKKNNYKVIPNFAAYKNAKSSICFIKNME